MADIKKPEARECFVIKALSQGESVIGKKGFVNCQLLGCCNNNRPRFYVPASILKITVHGCDEMRVVVKLEIPLLSADNQEMDVAPNGFFPSEESVSRFVEAQRVYNEYIKGIKPFTNYNRDVRHTRQVFITLLQETTEAIKSDIEDYCKEAGRSVSKLNFDELQRFGKMMVKSLYYPELDEDTEPDDMEDD